MAAVKPKKNHPWRYPKPVKKAETKKEGKK